MWWCVNGQEIVIVLLCKNRNYTILKGDIYMEVEKLQWHPAFSAALHIELEEELEGIDIEEEHLLGSKPMQIDVLVIKKNSNKPIHKNIGQIFKKHNIIEYKSPEDYLSINDFYKVYGYACFYQSDTNKILEINLQEVTITFVSNHYPTKMMKHLLNIRKMRIIKKEQGIYYLEGDIFCIQLLVVNELSKEENYWLQSLRNDIKTKNEMVDLLERYEKKKNLKWYEELMDIIVRANWKHIKEENEMCKALEEICEEMFADKINDVRVQGIEAGEKRGIQLTKKVLKLSLEGLSIDEIAIQCEISKDKVLEILE